MSYATIPDRVPLAIIERLTNAALAEYLRRHGWQKVEDWTHQSGAAMETYQFGKHVMSVPVSHRFADYMLRMVQSVGQIVTAHNARSAEVLDELTGIADWQARCAAWVAPVGNCGNCWACERELTDPWEAPPTVKFRPLCPTCGNKRCPRATDHRLECSGSNEPGQKGSRYT